ncbi:MAG: glycosyltransferase N-terminal domain-containing protein [Planctomycetota bacterium]
MNGLDLLYLALAGATAPIWARRARGGWDERFGRVDPARLERSDGSRPRVLLHAVSVGEAASLRTLVPLLADDLDVVVSATTDTGLARAEAMYVAGSEPPASVVRYPLDFSRSVRRFFDVVRPDLVALVELELWPNFIAECRRRRVPVGVIGGRLSASSFKGYRKARPLLRRMFASLEFVGAQDDDYAGRFVKMGTPADRVAVTGSMKWDNAKTTPDAGAADRLAAELGLDRGRPLVVAGSTGPGEEALLHRACEGLDCQLLCAPRRPDRFEDAARDLPGAVRRSAGIARAGDRYLLDTLGELAAAYALADVVVVGRTFNDMGGSDPTEPAGLGRPVIMGPDVRNFGSMTETLESAGGVLRCGREDLRERLGSLLADHAERARVGAAARESVEAQRGASRRNAELLRAHVRGHPREQTLR